MKLSINLASRRHINQRAVSLFFTLSFLVLVSVLVWQANLYLKDYRLAQTYRSHLSELKNELQGSQPERIDPQEVARRQQSFEQAQRLLDRDAFRWTALFDRMEALLPSGISLTSFNPDYKDKSLAINGMARDLKALQALLDNLQEERFDPVYLTSQGQAEVENSVGVKRTALTFTIRLGRVF